jgi:hypothetical protein
MVLKFRLISNEQDDFIRDFEILADQTFFQFHMAIQDNLHFDKTQIASFFTCTDNWEKVQEITLFELSDEEAAKVITMENARVGEFIKEVHDKMMYVFDVFNERLFFIELVEKNENLSTGEYPRCACEKGHPPQQLLMDQLFCGQDLSDGSIMDDFSYGEDFTGEGDLDELGYDSTISEDDFPDE